MAKIMQGTVISTKMQKTIVVEVQRVFAHPIYKKTIKRHKKYKAHNENTDIAVGDVVTIQETRPLSKDVHFKVVAKINK